MHPYSFSKLALDICCWLWGYEDEWGIPSFPDTHNLVILVDQDKQKHTIKDLWEPRARD